MNDNYIQAFLFISKNAHYGSFGISWYFANNSYHLNKSEHRIPRKVLFPHDVAIKNFVFHTVHP